MIEPLKNILYIARRYKLATTFNILGLTIAFVAIYLIMTQVIFQTTFNHDIKDSERLYRLDVKYMNNHDLFSDEIFFPFADALNDSLFLPDIESVSLIPFIYEGPVFGSYYELPCLTKDGKPIEFNWISGCNKTAFSTLISNRKVLSGNIDWKNKEYAQNPNKRYVIIPKTIAKTYFGSTDVAGDSIIISPSFSETSNGDTVYIIIQGVYEDFPENCEFQNYIYAPMNDKDEEDYKHDINSSTFKCVIKFKQVPSPKKLDKLIKIIKQAIFNNMDKEGWEKYAIRSRMSDSALKQAIKNMQIRLTPLKESYFMPHTLTSNKHGFRPMLIILMAACMLLIIISSIHFLNFVLVESPLRIRGVNTRLVLGASRKSLRRGIIAECVITAIISCVIALALCIALAHSPAVSQQLDGDITIWHHPWLALCTLMLAVIIGVASGLYPSIYVTSFIPAMALKRDYGLTPQGHCLRKVIITIQMFISFLMVIFLGILIHEKYFIFHSEYGFNKNQVLMSTLPYDTSDSTKLALYKKLTSLTGVKDVSFSDGSMGLTNTRGIQPAEIQGYSVSYEPTYVDSKYLRTMGIEMIKGLGRDFVHNDTSAAIINESTYKQWDWIGIDMKIPTENDSATIVGVCHDIRYNTTRFNSDQPFIFIIEPGNPCNQLNIGIEKDADRKLIQKLANEIIQKQLRGNSILDIEEKETLQRRIYPTPLVLYDQRLEESYKDEFRFFKWIFILSVVCTLITLIGVFCLMMFESEYRRKEIGIRKIVGATTGEIVTMLCKQYIPLILISFVIAAPIALYSANETLKYFAEHAPIKWWIFPLALLIVGGIVMTIILLQSWRTARENPVNSIKTE